MRRPLVVADRHLLFENTAELGLLVLITIAGSWRDQERRIGKVGVLAVG